MAWTLEGTYFENCSCDTICPCTWSALTAKATHDRCKAMLAFHIDRGDIDGVDVSGLTFALVADTPPVMSDGGWKLGVVVGKLNALKLAQATGSIPENVNFAVNAELARALLDKNGVKYETKEPGEPLSTPAVAERALKFTVMIECYR